MEMWVLKDEEVDNDVVDMCGDDKENLQKDHDVGKDGVVTFGEHGEHVGDHDGGVDGDDEGDNET